MQLRSGQRLESGAIPGLKMVSLDGQRTEHRLSNLALIAPSPVRSGAKPIGLAVLVYRNLYIGMGPTSSGCLRGRSVNEQEPGNRIQAHKQQDERKCRLLQNQAGQTRSRSALLHSQI